MSNRKEDKYRPLKRKVQITQLQQQAYDFIKQFREQHNTGPTFKEVANALGRQAKIGSILSSLRRRGYILWATRVPRSLNVVENRKQINKKTSQHKQTLRKTFSQKESFSSAPSEELLRTSAFIRSRIERLNFEIKTLTTLYTKLIEAETSNVETTIEVEQLNNEVSQENRE